MLDQLKEKTKKAADKVEGKLKLKENARKAASSAHKGVDKVEATLHIDIPEGALSSDDEDEEDGLIDGVRDQFAKLSIKQRLFGAIACYVISGGLAFVASLLLVTGVRRHVRWYAFLYLLSSLITFSSLLFIVGQKRLEKRMLNYKRQRSGRLWIGSLALAAILTVFFPGLWFFILVLLAVQFGAMIWYGSSFVPYGRKLVKKYVAHRIVHDNDSDK